MSANVKVPVFRISGAGGIVVFLYVFVTFGALHLAAISNPNKRWSKVILGLGF